MSRCACALLVAMGLVFSPKVNEESPFASSAAQGDAKVSAKKSGRTKSVADRLEAAFETAVRKGHLKAAEPGVIAVVIERGQPIFQKSFGLANVEKRSPIGPNTTFELASDSKMMTGYALLLLIQRGQVELNENVRTYLPGLPDTGANARLLVTHLVHHTSGLPEYLDFTPKHPGRSFVTNADYGRVLGTMTPRLTPNVPPGSKFKYTNTNYMLLALIIERVSGVAFSQFLKRNIFVPMGMEGAWVHEHPNVTPKVPGHGFVNAVGYERDRGGAYRAIWGAYPDREEEQLTVGDGAVWCSIEDMIQWERGLREHKGLSDATWQLATTPTTLNDGKPNDYGFGIGLGHNKQGKLTRLSHDGSWGGFHSSFHCDVARELTIIVLSNRADLDIGSFVDELKQALGD